MSRRPIIHNRRFYWLYADGRREPVRATEQLIQQMRQSSLQLRAAQRAVEETDASPRRITHPPRPPGIKPTLPSSARDIGTRTLSELAHDYGWGSVARCTTALKAQRPTVYAAARANGRARANVNLKQPAQHQKGQANEHQ